MARHHIRTEHPVPGRLREMAMVTIPKPGKNYKILKGWRPPVLGNCVTKLSEKAVSEQVQGVECLSYTLQFGSRKRRPAIEAMVLIKHLVDGVQLGQFYHATLLEKI